jgi:hypothetical protein
VNAGGAGSLKNGSLKSRRSSGVDHGALPKLN